MELIKISVKPVAIKYEQCLREREREREKKGRKEKFKSAT